MRYQAIHRGYAHYDSDVGYEWVTDYVIDGLERKHPDLLVGVDGDSA